VDEVVPEISRTLGVPGIGSTAGYVFTGDSSHLKTSAAIIYFEGYLDHGYLSDIENISGRSTTIGFSHNDISLEETLKNVECIGGLASDDWTFDRQAVFLDGSVLKAHSVGLSIDVPLSCSTDLAWVPLEGAVGRVTKFLKNRLYEIDGEPAKNFYEKNIGEMQLYGAFPLQLDDGINRTVVGTVFEDGSLLMTGNIEVGSEIQLLTVDPQSLGSSVKNMILSLVEKHDSAVVFSCLARQMMLGSRSYSEQETIGNHIGNSLTAYVYGEFVPDGKGSTNLQNEYIVGVGF